MTLISTLYASAPAAEVLIPTLEIDHPAFAAPIRTCAGFEDHVAGLGDANLVTGWDAGFIDLDSTDPALVTTTPGTRTTRWFPVWPSARYAVEVVSGAMDRRRVQWRMADGRIVYDGYAGGPGHIQAPAGAVQGRVYYASSNVTAGEIAVRPDDTRAFTASGLDVSLPARDASGRQNLAFAIENVTGQAQRAIDDALAAGGPVLVIYRSYIASDLSEPAEPPLSMVLVGAEFEGGTLQVTASYQDVIGQAWPRERYTAEFSPGLKYIG